jgi:hypothetical protein
VELVGRCYMVLLIADCLSLSQIFPNYAIAQCAVSKNSALARIRDRGAVLKRLATLGHL